MLFFLVIMAPFTVTSHNVGGISAHLGGLLHYLKSDAPDLVLLQEVPAIIDTDSMKAKVNPLGYDASCNVNAEDGNSVGTACLWKNTVPIESIFVNDIEPNRIQIVTVYNQVFVNVYAPAGTDQRPQRRDFYGQILFRGVSSLKSQHGVLPIIVGDHNCVLTAKDTEGQFSNSHKYCKTLNELVNAYKYEDAFRILYPHKIEYTWHRPGLSSSRIDRTYVPKHLVQKVLSVNHYRTLSDHYRVDVVLDLDFLPVPKSSTRNSTYWKLNVSVLQNEDF